MCWGYQNIYYKDSFWILLFTIIYYFYKVFKDFLAPLASPAILACRSPPTVHPWTMSGNSSMTSSSQSILSGFRLSLTPALFMNICDATITVQFSPTRGISLSWEECLLMLYWMLLNLLRLTAQGHKTNVSICPPSKPLTALHSIKSTIPHYHSIHHHPFTTIYNISSYYSSLLKRV